MLSTTQVLPPSLETGVDEVIPLPLLTAFGKPGNPLEKVKTLFLNAVRHVLVDNLPLIRSDYNLLWAGIAPENAPWASAVVLKRSPLPTLSLRVETTLPSTESVCVHVPSFSLSLIHSIS